MPTSLVMSPFGEFLGIEIESFGKGKALCSIAVKPHHFNAGGRVHGGVLTSLADSCAGVAVRSLRPEGVASATTDLNIAFIRPPMGNRLEAEAEVLHAGKRLYRVEMCVFSMTLGENQTRKLVAKCNATFMLVFPTNA